MTTTSTGRVVVLTGANQGIGYHLLRALVGDGYRVAGLDIDVDDVRAVWDTSPDDVRLYRRSRPSASGLDPEGEGRTCVYTFTPVGSGSND